MTSISALASRTGPTPGIDFSDNTLAHELLVWCFFDDTNELVTQNPLEPGIAMSNLDVGIAYPSKKHSNQTLPVPPRDRGLSNKS
jgi:hypothetical protein